MRVDDGRGDHEGEHVHEVDSVTSGEEVFVPVPLTEPECKLGLHVGEGVVVCVPVVVRLSASLPEALGEYLADNVSESVHVPEQLY